jgi:putative spermidine/putrescine transport system ATP-binding protein
VPLQDVMCLGSKTHLYGTAHGDDRIIAEVSGTAPLAAYVPGNPVTLTWPLASTLVYPGGAI